MELTAALRKELLIQWRTRAAAAAVLVFGATTLLLFSFAVGPSAESLEKNAAGFLWLALLLSSTLALSESFQIEWDQRGLEGLLLLPVHAHVVFYAKAIANWLQLFILGVFLLPVMVVLYNASLSRPVEMIGIILLGGAGLSAPGTLYAAMAAGSRARQSLLPLLLFPLVVPVLLASVKATSLLMHGDPMNQLRSWTTLLVAFDAIFWSLCGLLFQRVVED